MRLWIISYLWCCLNVFESACKMHLVMVIFISHSNDFGFICAGVSYMVSYNRNV